MRPEPLIPFALYEPFLDCCHYGAAAEEEEEVVETTGAEKGAGEAAEAGGDMTAPLPPPGPPPSGAGGEEEEEGEGEGGGEPKTPPPTPDRAQRPQAEEEEGLPPAVVVRMAVSAEGEGEGGPAQQEGEEGRDGGEKENASAVTSAAAGAGAEAAGWGGGGKGASGPRATIALDRLSGMLSRLPPRSKGQIEALLGLVRRVATAPTGGGEELHGPTVAGLGAVLGPLLARPKGAAHLSLRHARELPRLASLGSALIQHCHTLQQPEQECSHSGGSNHLSPSSCPASPLGSSLGMATAPAFLSSSSGHGAGLSPAKSGRRSLSPCQSPRHQQPQQHLPHGSPSPPSAPDDGSGQQNERSKQQEEEQRRRQRQEREEARAVLQGQLLPGLVRRFLNGASDDGPLPSAGNGQVGYQVGRSVTHPQYNASLLLLQAHKQQCGGDSVFSSSIASVASSSASHPPRPASPYSCPLGSLGLDALSLLDSSPQRRSRSGSDDSSGGLGMRQRRRLISGCRALQEQIKRCVLH